MRITSSEWILHPEGIFRGRITAIEPTNRFVEGIPEMAFTIETAPINEDGPIRSIRHTIHCILSDMSQFSRLFRAVCGKEIQIDAGLPTNKLVGGQGILEISHYIKENNRKGHRIKHSGHIKNVNLEQLGQSIALAPTNLSVGS